MNKYILLFRGINVSGQKIIKMAELKLLLESIGLKKVITYIQSGNVIFESEVCDIKHLETIIKDVIFNNYNFEVEIFICDFETVSSALKNNPYKYHNYSIKSVYIGFIIAEYNENNYNQIKSLEFTEKYKPEEFEIIENILYFYIPNGQAKSKFSNNFFEKKLNTIITTRNVNTCQKLIEILNNSI